MATNDPKVAERINELIELRKTLLDKYGVFGGGEKVNRIFDEINDELDVLGYEY